MPLGLYARGSLRAAWADPAGALADQQAAAALQPRYEASLPDLAWFRQRLAQFGYGVPLTGVDQTLDKATRDVLISFQMRFRPARYDGQPDAETAAILATLTTP